MSTCAVGVSVTKSWKRRPLIGRLAIAEALIVLVVFELLVSTPDTRLVTVTFSATPATGSAMFTLKFEPTVTTVR